MAETHEPASPPTRRRVRVVALLSTAVIALAGMTSWWLFFRSSDDLPHRHPHVTYQLHPLSPADTSFTLGAMDIKEYGKTVQVLSVKALMSANVEYLGAYTVWARDKATSQLDVGPGYPSPYQPQRHPLTEVVPAAEMSVKASGQDPVPLPLNVVLGFRVRSGDLGAVNGVRVTYRANGKLHHQYFPYSVIACVEPNPCHAPNDGDSQDWWDQVFYQLGLAPTPDTG
jgi:hypothetical protein